jgi:hypothetical protein
MLKQNVEFLDLEGNKCSETMHFNLTENEMTDFILHEFPNGNVQESMNAMLKEGNQTLLFDTFHHITEAAYGTPSEDKKHFYHLRNENEKRELESSCAYQELLTKLSKDESFATKFYQNIFPKDLLARAEKEAKEQLSKQ